MVVYDIYKDLEDLGLYDPATWEVQVKNPNTAHTKIKARKVNILT